MPEKNTQRTDRQNKALHKYFRLLADELNSAGLDMRKVLNPEIDIPWTGESIKNHLWRPTQDIMLGKQSTAELTTKDIDTVYEVIDKFTSETHHIHIPFPSEEEPMIKELT